MNFCRFNGSVFGDTDLVVFNERLIKALYREKFNREEPKNTTHISVVGARKFYFEHNETKVFVCYPPQLFEKIIMVLWRIAKSYDTDQNDPSELLEKLYNDRSIQLLIQEYSWGLSFDLFYDHLIEESFFYFDDMNEQYYFNLFRNIKGKEFVGGVLHALTRHYDDFYRFNPKPNGKFDFKYGSFFVDLMMCCLDGDIVGERIYITKYPENFNLNKRIRINDKYLNVGLYWDNQKQLYFLKTVYLSSK